MPHIKGPESDLGRTLSRSRSTSMSSDSLSCIYLTPPPAKPPPSFITSSSAAQIVTADQEFNTADFVADEGEDSDARAVITPEALSALNGFLDHLLFNILAAAKSTQLAFIRPAVADVLKPRLAKEVVSAADKELSEYMRGPDDDQFEFCGAQSQNGDFDLIRSWIFTRLRCMVYTRLGDLEEDDEEEYIVQNGLGDDGDLSPRFSSHVGNITPAAAIFLTSIVEHLGEQALVIAGETARSRLSAKPSHEETEAGTERGTINRLVVEDLDMEKLALNPTLGRLWRTWRRQTRSPVLSRAVSRESIRRRSAVVPSTSRKSSVATVDKLPSKSLFEIPKEVDPASVALPMSDHDVEEIEGFTSDAEGAEVIQTMEAVVAHKVRPHSLMVLTLSSSRLPTPIGGSPITLQNAKFTRHVRSRSLPGASPQEATEVDQATDRPSPTASEEQNRLETMYERDEDDVVPKIDPEIKKPETNVSPEESVNQEKVATSSQSALSVEVETSRANSTGSSTSLSDRPQTDSDAEVIEGQGMCEKLKQPKRICSRDAAREDDRSTSTTRVASERAIPAVVDDPPPTQGGDSTPGQPAVSRDVSKDSEQKRSSTELSPSHTWHSTERDDKLSRPVSTSGESGYSDRLRTQPRPSPSAGISHHRYGRSSSGVSSISSGTERAAVQRVIRPSTSAASSVYSKSRRSDSFSSQREKRPVTAGSTTSQVSSRLKGLIGLQGDSASLRLRSSSEASRVSALIAEPDDKSGLDELIRSEETLHYTLTPKTMRKLEEPDSPRWPASSSTAELAENPENSAPPGEEIPRPNTSNTSSRDTTNTPKYTPIEIPQNANLGQTSDAKPSNGSISDYAHSVQSTGPSSPRGAQSPRSPSSTGRTFPKLQARSAVPSKAAHHQTSDLIDFIREGPPVVGAHRIPRTVAPFRDTMDSDELNSLETGHTDNDAPSVSSTQTSVGSRTSLLESGNLTNAVKPIPTALSGGSHPVRKPQRVRDPYAIDSDNEDLDELLDGPKPKRKEESLMNFLRNVHPSESERTGQPPKVNTVPSKSPSGAFGMKARLRRNTSGDKVPTTKLSKSSLRQKQDSYTGTTSNYSVTVYAERGRDAMHGTSSLPSVTDRQTETSALAEFLRTTGPPEPPAPRVSALSASKGKDSGSNSLSRFFGRRKKLEV
ncbi:hypothetical protein BDV28DRAFT_142460 [Aspergillus coremiiformis]|uniref:Uncharacterized protein n=1 Tax=Aspergillus coremiiformis TaxID=138285 RepID=A0A5N6YTZ7_9EURO|nr:hypothetical protein BDV28DRAFT_142460 [Aspergillus coremiiformis]